jgi:hypothetical protein
MDVPYISMQSKIKKSSQWNPSYKTLNIKWNNSRKNGLSFFEIEIWYASLALRKNWYIILEDQKYQLHFILSKDLWMRQ